MKRTALALTTAALLSGNAYALAFSAGDIQIIGFRSDAPDSIDFVTWVDLAPGVSLFFTDSGVLAGGDFRGTEDEMEWNNNTGGTISPGTVISYTSGVGADLGTIASGGLGGLSSGGDQVFVGDAAFPTTNPGAYAGNIIYGIDWDGASWSGTGATSSNTSLLPAAINSTDGNIDLPEVDNGVYTGPRTGLTIAQYKAAIANLGNWTTSNTSATMDSTDFSIVPEPTSLALIGLGGLLIARRRRA